jgi:predicted ATP-grasp superfamily ATP-dependent carboligase
MSFMGRIFVYEYLSSGGPIEGSDSQRFELLAMGQAMRDAITADLLALEDYEVTVATCSQARPVLEGALSATPDDGESAIDFVVRLADAHHLVWAVAPETAGVLAQLQRSIDPGRWLGCNGAAIKLATGKRATLLTLAAAGIATPLAFEHDPKITRWIVKPDDGAGATSTRLHGSLEAALEDWSQRSRSDGPMAIEPWVEGQAMSLSMLCGGPHGENHVELLSINRQQLRVDDEGVLTYLGVEVNAMPLTGRQGTALRALAARVNNSIPGLSGYVGVDLVWHARRGPVVIEVNPRVTCAYVGLSQALGRNLAADVIAIHRRGLLDGNH